MVREKIGHAEMTHKTTEKKQIGKKQTTIAVNKNCRPRSNIGLTPPVGLKLVAHQTRGPVVVNQSGNAPPGWKLLEVTHNNQSNHSFYKTSQLGFVLASYCCLSHG